MIPQDRTPTSRRAIDGAFRRTFLRAPRVLVRAPGRINLLGAHVDYQEGWVLPAAIDRGLWLAAAPASGKVGRIHALDLSRSTALNPRELPPPRAGAPRPISWSDYPAGVAWALRQEGLEPPAMDVVFGGDLPRESGVSSSAALEVAFLLAWRHLAGFDLPRDRIAALGRRAENSYLGVGSGIMDQLASLHGRAGHFLFLDCRDLSRDWIPLPEGVAFLVADSGVRRKLAASGFNDRPGECAAAVARLRQGGWPLRALRDLAPGDLAKARPLLEPTIFRRVRHVVEECDRVQRGAAALNEGELGTFGGLVRESHISSRDLYEVSIPELDVLAEAAWECPGVYGARLSGGGFGGCVTALLAEGAVDEAKARMVSAFESRFGRRPGVVFECRSARGAEVFESPGMALAEEEILGGER